MTRPVCTFRSDHPRLWCNTTQKTAITTRTNTAASWQDTWDNRVIDEADFILGESVVNLARDSTNDYKALTLGLAGWIDSQTTYHDHLLSVALELAQNVSWPSFSSKRKDLMCLAFAYDFLASGVITFSDANKKIIGDKLLVETDAGSPSDEYIDGASGGNHQAQLMGAVVLQGESGTGFDYTTSSLTPLNSTLDFWYGENPGDVARFDYERYAHSDGGGMKSPWYHVLSDGFALRILWTLATSTTAITLDGEAYDPLTDEDWVPKLAEYWTRMFYRGDEGYMATADTFRPSGDPFLEPRARFCLGFLIAQGDATFRGPLRYVRDRLDVLSDTAPFKASQEYYAQEIVLWDPSDAGNASVALESASYPNHRLSDPPGHFIYDSSKDPTTGVRFYMDAKEFDFAGHQHLTSGGIQVWFQNDCVLGWTGRFQAQDGLREDFGGVHNRNWYQQGIGHSGTVLVDEPGATHTQRDENGSRTEFPTGLGGPRWKHWTNDGALPTPTIDPPNITEMRTDGSNMAWRRAGIDSSGTNKLRIVDSRLLGGQDDYIFLSVDNTQAYLREDIDEGTTAQSVTMCEHKWLLLPNVWSWPMLFRMVRVKSRVATFTKRDHWHSWNDFTILADVTNDLIRLTSTGVNNVGKIVIDYPSAGGLWLVNKFGGVAANNLSAPFQYGGGAFGPTRQPNIYERNDFAQFRVEVRPVVARTDDTFVCLLMPMGVTDQPPAYTWIREANDLGLDFQGLQFRVSREGNVVNVIGGTDPPDTTAPQIPGGVSASQGDLSGEIDVMWSPNTDDTTQYKIYTRVKV